MQIHTHTDSTIEGREALAIHVTEVVERALNRSSDHITRVEVHLSDESGGKQLDMRCVMEARLAHHQPVVITESAASLHQAIDGAARKLVRAISSSVGRIQDNNARRDDVAALAPDEAAP